MKVIYFGTAPFAVPALERIAPAVVAVVSQPARPTGRNLQVQPSPVANIAQRLGLPVLTPEKARGAEFIAELNAFDANIFVVAAYGQILRKSVLDAAPGGCFNLHGSLLPAWRGAAPIQRSIEAGEGVTGVTLMKMDEGMDTGGMIEKSVIQVGDDETAGEVTVRLAAAAADLLQKRLRDLVEGVYAIEDQDSSQATHAAKILKEDGFIRANDDAKTAYNRFRAVTPNPGATIETIAGPIKIHQARLLPDHREPGEVVRVKPTLVVSLVGGSLELREVQPQGRRRMSGAEFANGARILPGSRLF